MPFPPVLGYALLQALQGFPTAPAVRIISHYTLPIYRRFCSAPLETELLVGAANPHLDRGNLVGSDWSNEKRLLLDDPRSK